MTIEQKVGQMTQIDVTAVVSYVGDCPTGFLWEDALSCQVPRGCLMIQKGGELILRVGWGEGSARAYAAPSLG